MQYLWLARMYLALLCASVLYCCVFGFSCICFPRLVSLLMLQVCFLSSPCSKERNFSVLDSTLFNSLGMHCSDFYWLICLISASVLWEIWVCLCCGVLFSKPSIWSFTIFLLTLYLILMWFWWVSIWIWANISGRNFKMITRNFKVVEKKILS